MGMTTSLQDRLTQQRQDRWRKILYALLALALFAGAAAAAYFWVDTSLQRQSGVLSPQGRINILVMGVDERAGDAGRSDTMMLFTVNPATREVSLLSIPRDTRVKIPGHGYDKINAAYAYGGHTLAMRAVQDLLGVPINHYILINFQGFTNFIDALGGVDIDVEKRMYYTDPYDNLEINLQPGRQHMDGRTAIQYVRYRDEEGDIGRIQRQQKFVQAVLAKAASPAVLSHIPALVQQVGSLIKTDMSPVELINLAGMISDAYKHGLKTDMVPGRPAYLGGISYWLPNLVDLRRHIAEIMGVVPDERYMAAAQQLDTEYQRSVPKEMKVAETPAPPKSPAAPAKPAAPPASNRLRVEVVNASGVASAGARVADTLRAQGFEVVAVSNVGTAYDHTVVVANTTDTAVVNRLSALPFRYALQVSKKEGAAADATVYVGRDYASPPPAGWEKKTPGH